MEDDRGIAALRSRVTELVKQEAALLSQALELSRAGDDRRGVDALFAQVQALQLQRGGLQKEIGQFLGTQRLHVASEVCSPGIYEYREDLGSQALRVKVDKGDFGLEVCMPGREQAVSIGKLKGTFDGPLAVDGEAPDASRCKSPASTPLPELPRTSDPAPAAPARTARRSADA